jgi:hypothetical protein
MHSARAAACRGAGGGPAPAGIDRRAPEAARPPQDSGGRRIAAGAPSRPFFFKLICARRAHGLAALHAGAPLTPLARNLQMVFAGRELDNQRPLSFYGVMAGNEYPMVMVLRTKGM